MPSKPTRPAVSLKKTALPTEHGSWGFLLEPLAAALSIGPTAGGASIALMTVGGFLLRQPFKTYVIDRLGMRVPERARVAMYFIAIFGVTALAGLIGAVFAVGPRPLVPFIATSPLILYQIYSDTQRRSRGLWPELSGAVTMSASAAAVILASGGSWLAAGGLWAVLFARLFSSVLYVRERLLLEKGKPYRTTAAVVSHMGALAIIILLASLQAIPFMAVLAFAILLYRCVRGLSPNRRRLKAMQIGVREVIYGAILVACIIIGHYTGL